MINKGINRYGRYNQEKRKGKITLILNGKVDKGTVGLNHKSQSQKSTIKLYNERKDRVSSQKPKQKFIIKLHIERVNGVSSPIPILKYNVITPYERNHGKNSLSLNLKYNTITLLGDGTMIIVNRWRCE